MFNKSQFLLDYLLSFSHILKRKVRNFSLSKIEKSYIIAGQAMAQSFPWIQPLRQIYEKYWCCQNFRVKFPLFNQGVYNINSHSNHNIFSQTEKARCDLLARYFKPRSGKRRLWPAVDLYQLIFLLKYFIFDFMETCHVSLN